MRGANYSRCEMFRRQPHQERAQSGSAGTEHSKYPTRLQMGHRCHRAPRALLDRGSRVTGAESALVFKSFFRSGDSTQRVEGLGLALAVCKRLIEAQGGRMWFTPREGGGSEFGFSLDLCAESPAPAAPGLTTLVVPGRGFEPLCLAAAEFKSAAYAIPPPRFAPDCGQPEPRVSIQPRHWLPMGPGLPVTGLDFHRRKFEAFGFASSESWVEFGLADTDVLWRDFHHLVRRDHRKASFETRRRGRR